MFKQFAVSKARKAEDSTSCYLIYVSHSLSGTKVMIGKKGGQFYWRNGPLHTQMKNCSIATARLILSSFLFPVTLLSTS